MSTTGSARSERSAEPFVRVRDGRRFKMEWSYTNSLKLIQEYKSHEFLWNPRHPEYFSKSKKMEAWNNIAHNLRLNGIDCHEVQKKMKSLLGSFRRERSKTKLGQRTDQGENAYKSRWFAYKSLEFLIGKNQYRRSQYSEMKTESEIGLHEESETIDDIFQVEEENIEETEFVKIDQFSQKQEPFENHEDPPEDVLADSSSTNHNGQRKADREDQMIEDNFSEPKKSFLTVANNPYTSYGQHIANKMMGYSARTRAFVEHNIGNVLFDADLGKFDGDLPERNEATVIYESSDSNL